MRIVVKLKSLLVTSAFILVGISLVYMGVTLYSLNQLNDSKNILLREDKFELGTEKAKFNIVQIQQFLTDASLTHESASIDEAKTHLEESNKILENLVNLQPSLKEEIDKIKQSVDLLYKVGDEMTQAYWQSGKIAGDAIMKRPQTGLDAASEMLGQQLDNLADRAQTRQKLAENNLEQSIQDLKIQTYILSIILFLTAISVFALLFKRLAPLSYISELLNKNSVKLQETSNSSRKTAEGISYSNNEQAAATQQTAASIEEIRAMVTKTSENSQKLDSGALKSEELVNQGMESLRQVQSSLSKISVDSQNLVNDVEQSNRDVLSITKIISEIGDKTKIINDIVFQTKLLSFNASVEAARAGEHGKGFAVVAEEVGNLAAMSGKAAKEISEMLDNGLRKVDSILKENEQRISSSVSATKLTIQQGVETAEICESSFQQIIEKVADVKIASHEITTAIEEQVKGLDEIGKAIESLDLSTQSNVTASHNVEKDSELLSATVVELSESIDKVNEIILGKKSA